jgi:hypothetical protein
MKSSRTANEKVKDGNLRRSRMANETRMAAEKVKDGR